jgi:hypothetical protein
MALQWDEVNGKAAESELLQSRSQKHLIAEIAERAEKRGSFF